MRDTDVVEGHAVRQLYLTAGVTDLYLETGEQALWDALMRQWTDFTARKMHVTGGAGARHEGEAFGEAYELPNDRCYCETCAQIASIHWNWRLLLATGDARYADLMERTLYNGFLSGVSLDGSRYFYVNPLLQSRRHRASGMARLRLLPAQRHAPAGVAAPLLRHHGSTAACRFTSTRRQLSELGCRRGESDAAYGDGIPLARAHPPRP